MSGFVQFEIPYAIGRDWKKLGLIPAHWQILHQENTINWLVRIPETLLADGRSIMVACSYCRTIQNAAEHPQCKSCGHILLDSQ